MPDHDDACEDAGGAHPDLEPAIYRVCERAREPQDPIHEPEQAEELKHQLQRCLGCEEQQHADDDRRDALDEHQPPREYTGGIDAALNLERAARRHRGTSGPSSFHAERIDAYPETSGANASPVALDQGRLDRPDRRMTSDTTTRVSIGTGISVPP